MKPNPPMDQLGSRSDAGNDLTRSELAEFSRIFEIRRNGGKFDHPMLQSIARKILSPNVDTSLANESHVKAARRVLGKDSVADTVRMLENDISLLEARKRAEPRRRAALDAEIAGKRFEIGQYELAAGRRLARADAKDMDERDCKDSIYQFSEGQKVKVASGRHAGRTATIEERRPNNEYKVTIEGAIGSFILSQKELRSDSVMDMDERDWKGVEEWIAEEKGEGEHRGDNGGFSKAISKSEEAKQRLLKRLKAFKAKGFSLEAAKREFDGGLFPAEIERAWREDADVVAALDALAEKVNELGRAADAISSFTPKGAWRLGWDRQKEGSPKETKKPEWWSDRTWAEYLAGYEAASKGEPRK